MTDETRYPRVADLLSDVAALREENRRLREALQGMMEALPATLTRENMVPKLRTSGFEADARLVEIYCERARQAAALLKPPAAAGDG